MALVVHEPFEFNGREYKRGDVVRGSTADAIATHSLNARRCSAVPDSVFAEPSAVVPDFAPARSEAAREPSGEEAASQVTSLSRPIKTS